MNYKNGHVLFIVLFFFVATIGIMSSGVAMILTGFWLLSYILWIRKVRQNLLTNGLETKASIIKNENNSEGILVSHYEFTTSGGANVQGKGFTNSYEGEKGQIIEVLYNTTAPNEFILKKSVSNSNKYLFFSILIAIFLFFCITGYLLLQ